MNMTNTSNAYRGRVCVVTGAASGMGRQLSLQLADHGARLALCDINGQLLAEVAEACRRSGTEVLETVVDVAERDAVHRFADAVVQRFDMVHYVFNNAGIGAGGSVENFDYKEFEKVIDINFWGVVYGTKAFLPYLKASGDGHIVNISSVYGLLSGPFSSPYNAAKFAVRGFTESLRQEMLVQKAPIKVTCVHPGFVKTDIFKATTFNGSPSADFAAMTDKLAITSAKSAAATILAGAAKGKSKVLVGPDAYLYDALARILGAWYQRPTAMLLGRLIPKQLLAEIGSAPDQAR